jgi:hypothetical protein
MRWKALLRDFSLDGVLSTTTHDKYLAKAITCFVYKTGSAAGVPCSR